MNLHEEDQVDLVMRVLDDLQFLNGLPVERDILEEEEGEDEDLEMNPTDSKTKEMVMPEMEDNINPLT